MPILDVGLRLTAATTAGMLVGLNRDLAGKAMGMRTLGLVSLGSAAVAVATIQHSNLSENADALSRVVQGIIQGVMAGISFIGAGVILRDPRAKLVDGLTTAATVWVAAAIGIAAGIGAWTTMGIVLFLTLLLLSCGPLLERLMPNDKVD